MYAGHVRPFVEITFSKYLPLKGEYVFGHLKYSIYQGQDVDLEVYTLSQQSFHLGRSHTETFTAQGFSKCFHVTTLKMKVG